MASFSFTLLDSLTDAITHEPQYLKASDGILLAYYPFMPTQPHAIIIFYHGGGAWSSKLYQAMAQRLMQNYQIGTYLVDIRGHGNSEGPRGDTPSPQQVWQDITTMIDVVKKKHPDTSLFLGGHSSGAGLVLNYAGWEQHAKISGYLFLAPFLGSTSQTSYEHKDPQKRFIKKVRLLPLLLNAITNGALYAHTPVIFFNYSEEQLRNDPLLLTSYTCAMAQAVTPQQPKKLFAQLHKPFLLAIGSQDEQFIPHKIVAFKEYAYHVKDNSYATIIPHATHLSIVLDAIPTIAEKIMCWQKSIKIKDET